jgi:hypothetical protein
MTMTLEKITSESLTRKLADELNAKFPNSAVGFTIGFDATAFCIAIRWHGKPSKQTVARIAEKHLGDFPMRFDRSQ